VLDRPHAAQVGRGLVPRLFALLAPGLLLVATCVPEETGDFALCCTCLQQRSPINDGDAVDPSTNCLPDDTEVDGCNAESASQISQGAEGDAIRVTDENCVEVTCLEECRGARLRGARFVVEQQSLTR
jgi:hypothetical protein